MRHFLGILLASVALLAGAAHASEEDARALLADAERLTAANAVERAEEAVEAALDLEFDDRALRVDLLNQAAVLRIMRSDWLGAWALLNRAETLEASRATLPPDAQVNILRSLLELPIDWNQDVRLQAGTTSSAPDAYLRAGNEVLLRDATLLRNAEARLRELPANEALPGRVRQLDADLRELPDSRETADLLLAFADLVMRIERDTPADQGLHEPAARHLQRVDAIGRATADDWLRSFANGYLGEILLAEGRPAEARRMFDVALLFAQRGGNLEASYRWHWRLAELELAAGDLAAAEADLELAITQLDQVREELPYLSSDVFARFVLPVYRRYVDVLLQQASRLDEGARPPVLRRARDTLEALKQAEVEDYFARQCVVDDSADYDPAALGQTAVYYPVILADRVEILVETRDALVQRTVVVDRAEVTEVIREFRLMIEDFESDEDYFLDAEQLHAWLFAPIEDTLAAADVDTVIVIPDGPLRTVPIAALHDGDGFLVERFAFVTTPAISLTSFATAEAGTGSPSSMLVGGLSEGVQGFSPLPGVAREVRLLDERFSPETFVNQSFLADRIASVMSAGDYEIAHFATHGSFSSDHRQSFLLTYDETLSMSELETLISARQGDALELLVLSACQTAAGDDRAALGLAGVAVQAGARSAVASLWFISDAATAALVREFYEALIDRGLDRAQALRSAQLHLLQDMAGFDHPSFWAPYLLIGARS